MLHIRYNYFLLSDPDSSCLLAASWTFNNHLRVELQSLDIISIFLSEMTSIFFTFPLTVENESRPDTFVKHFSSLNILFVPAAVHLARQTCEPLRPPSPSLLSSVVLALSWWRHQNYYYYRIRVYVLSFCALVMNDVINRLVFACHLCRTKTSMAFPI